METNTLLIILICLVWIGIGHLTLLIAMGSNKEFRADPWQRLYIIFLWPLLGRIAVFAKIKNPEETK